MIALNGVQDDHRSLCGLLDDAHSVRESQATRCSAGVGVLEYPRSDVFAPEGLPGSAPLRARAGRSGAPTAWSQHKHGCRQGLRRPCARQRAQPVAIARTTLDSTRWRLDMRMRPSNERVCIGAWGMAASSSGVIVKEVPANAIAAWWQ